MKSYERVYRRWKSQGAFYPDLQRELAKIADDTAEIQDRFYKDLEFGTGGIRGVLGYGTNRINVFTIRRASLALAKFLLENGSRLRPRVAIAYDSRHKSREFALESALVLAKEGIQAYVFSEITATPLLSYAVQELAAGAGIVITASHNPKEYNGYKVYAPYGGQLTDRDAENMIKNYNIIKDEFSIVPAERQAAEQAGLLVWLGDNILEKYLEKTLQLILEPDLVRKKGKDLQIVYTPLHGTGRKPVAEILKRAGFSHTYLVPEQAEADPDFKTLKTPNPEERKAYEKAEVLAKSTGAHIILATDPDGDRTGLMVKDDKGDYVQLTGNEIGTLLIDYILRRRQEKGTLPENGLIIKTIVTSQMGARLAETVGVKHVDVLTGFKYIGEKIALWEKTREHTFLFGYEESQGYLIGDYIRDKDGIQTCLMLAETALFWREQGKNPLQRLAELYEELGYYKEDLINLSLPGLLGQHRLDSLLNSLRQNPPAKIGGLRVLALKDYLTGTKTDFLSGAKETLTLPSSNALFFTLEEEAWCCFRPSGTEPKLKVYLAVRGASSQESEQRLEGIRHYLWNLLQP